MNILGIETSCDETACAVVKDGREVLSNVVYTQIPLHVPYGGVVPEIASRAHVEKIPEVLSEAMTRFRAAEPLGTIDAVAVTYGPGLAPALTVGLNAAKGLAASLHVPFYGINHIKAHLHTPFLRDPDDADGYPSPEECFPALGLAVSGGHTNWFDMEAPGRCTTIGQTLDDAAGEAFDKAAKMLSLGYPGGPVIDKIAKAYAPSKPLVPFPKGRPREGVASLAGLPAELCVSFSGLKTALLRYVEANRAALDSIDGDGGIEYAPGCRVSRETAHTVVSYQEAIVSAIADRTHAALSRKAFRSLIVGGGVSLNSRLRSVLKETAEKRAVRLLLSKPKYCGDNAAMIAALAFFERDAEGEAAMSLDVSPSLEIPSAACGAADKGDC